MGNDDSSWTSMKRFIGDQRVVDKIMNFDAHGIDRVARAEVEELLESKAASFDEKAAKRARHVVPFLSVSLCFLCFPCMCENLFVWWSFFFLFRNLWPCGVGSLMLPFYMYVAPYMCFYSFVSH